MVSLHFSVPNFLHQSVSPVPTVTNMISNDSWYKSLNWVEHILTHIESKQVQIQSLILILLPKLYWISVSVLIPFKP